MYIDKGIDIYIYTCLKRHGRAHWGVRVRVNPSVSG